MNIFQSLCKHATVAMMIAATGLPVSVASAQFQVEHSVKSERASSAKAPEKTKEKKTETKSQTVMVFKSDEGGQAFELKFVDGQVVFAELNGKELPPKQIKVKGKTAYFTSEDGSVVFEVAMPSAPSAPHAPHAPTATWTSGGNTFDIQVTQDGTHPTNKQQVRVMEQPKVMLGINLSEPSQALRKHLKLSADAKVILVENVIEGLPAAKAGLEDFDVIVSLDGSDSADSETLSKVLRNKNAGDQLKVIVLRAGDKVKLDVKLAAYDSDALSGGSVSFSSDFEFDDDDQNNFRFFTSDDMPDFEGMDDETRERFERNFVQGRDQVAALRLKSAEHAELAEAMRAKARDAMRDVERQIIEFKDGKLVVRTSEDIEKKLQSLTGRIQDRFPDVNSENLDAHMQELDARLSELESRLDEQMNRMSANMDRLSLMFERMMDRLESKLKD